MERREFYSNKWKLAGWLCVSLAFVAGGIFKSRDSSGLEQAGWWFCAVLFGLGALFFINEIVRPGARLVLSDQGLFDRSLSTTAIPWQSILRVDTTKVKKSGIVSLQLTDTGKQLARLSLRTRAVASWNKMLGGDDGNLIHTNLSTLKASPSEVAASIVQYRDHYAPKPSMTTQR